MKTWNFTFCRLCVSLWFDVGAAGKVKVVGFPFLGGGMSWWRWLIWVSCYFVFGEGTCQQYLTTEIWLASKELPVQRRNGDEDFFNVALACEDGQ